MPPRYVFDPPQNAALRRDVESGMPLWQIAQKYRIHPDTIRNMARREGWMWPPRRGRRPKPPPSPPAPPLIDFAAAPPGDDVPLAGRIQRQLEQALAAVERIVPQVGVAPAHDGADRTTRALRSLVNALRELRQLKLAHTPAAGELPAPAPSDHDNDGPETLAELRRSLCERLEALVARDAGAIRGRTEGT
jgi:hypothetical protein